ncbi:MAG: 5'-methylthioadenosine/adenosylhomocysteine nucleosidase [Clostridia bacterium]|nr:5'-methylthioadenosine/adenosylhomocysteine nucleosidase [Clostridia bacterium]
MNKIGIISAMEVEANRIKNAMTDVVISNKAGLTFFEGKIGKTSVVLAVSGVGKVNASICVQTLINVYNVDFVINSGIAGSLQDKASHLSVVVSDVVYYHDIDFLIFNNNYPGTNRFYADKTQTENFIKCNPTAVLGGIVTGDKFVSSGVEKAEIVKKGNAICVEMEGGAVGHVCFVNDVPFMVLRCISDMADDNATTTYEDFETIAANKIADMVINYLQSL